MTIKPIIMAPVTDPAANSILIGANSPENAATVSDYPYGFRLRCQQRYWLDVSKTRGTRLMSQTTNPKEGNRWNKPKASTYTAPLEGIMYMVTNDEGHIQQAGFSFYNLQKEDERGVWLWNIEKLLAFGEAAAEFLTLRDKDIIAAFARRCEDSNKKAEFFHTIKLQRAAAEAAAAAVTETPAEATPAEAIAA